MWNKKVLLRERKRHTDRCVASTRYVASGGGGAGQGAPCPGPGPGGEAGEGRDGVPPIQVQAGGGPLFRSRWGGGAGHPPVQVQVSRGRVGWGAPRPGPGGGVPGYPPRDVNRQTNWKYNLLSYYVRGR